MLWNVAGEIKRTDNWFKLNQKRFQYELFNNRADFWGKKTKNIVAHGKYSMYLCKLTKEEEKSMEFDDVKLIKLMIQSIFHKSNRVLKWII